MKQVKILAVLDFWILFGSIFMSFARLAPTCELCVFALLRRLTMCAVDNLKVGDIQFDGSRNPKSKRILPQVSVVDGLRDGGDRRGREVCVAGLCGRLGGAVVGVAKVRD